MSYTSRAAIKAELGIPTAVTTDDSIIDAKILEATAEIDRLSGRHFEAVTKTKNYNQFYGGWGVDTALLLLDDDLLTVTSLTNGDGTTIPSSGYWLEPQNGGWYSAIRLKSSYSWTFGSDGDGSIVLVGTFGHNATVPDDIAGICKELAIALYKLKDIPTMTAAVLPDAGPAPFPIALPKHAEAIIANYRSLV